MELTSNVASPLSLKLDSDQSFQPELLEVCAAGWRSLELVHANSVTSADELNN